MASTVTKTCKFLRLKNQNGRSMQIVREHYLREDVPCYSEACLAECAVNQDPKLTTLPAQVTHYVVPDCGTAKNYLEILEYPDITGIIFMQTVTHCVQHEGSRRHLKRLQKLISNPQKRSILFHNEFQRFCYCPREPGETLVQWQSRSVFESARWYFNHLAAQKPIVILSEDREFKKNYATKQLGVHIYDTKEYLTHFWPNLSAAVDLFDSLSDSMTRSSKGNEYSGYLPSDVLESGIKNGKFLPGCLQVNKHNSQKEAFVRRTGHSAKNTDDISDILISGVVARNRAIHGDNVVVEILPKSQWVGRSSSLNSSTENDERSDELDIESNLMPTGQIVGILQRKWRDYVCSFAEDEDKKTGPQKKSGKVLVVPMDWRIPKIRISTRQIDALRDNRIIVRIDNWETTSQYPNGHFVRALGIIGELETEIQAILVEHSISVQPFSEGSLKELPTDSEEQPWIMDPAEIEKRRDLRLSHLIFSIDPVGCEDVDDTLSIRELPGGGYELGVHIADVTAFVNPDSVTDLEAKSRSTTVYMADRRYDMLPAVLSAKLCSLISGVDRYAMSVIWTMNRSYEVKDVWYGRTVINSAYKLFYEIAQKIHDGASDVEIIENVPELQHLPDAELAKRLKDLRWSVCKLMEVARALKSRRTSVGGLELEGSEVTIQMDKSKEEITNLLPKQSLEIHDTIAECMIFANHWVAKKIYESLPNQALLRHHPLPRVAHFDNLINCAKSRGFEIKTQSNKLLAESLDQCIDMSDPNVNKILRSLATQAMSNAQYFSTGSLPQNEYFHYGLALGFYTHFTSPIRRYADVIVHRTLLAAIESTNHNQLIGNKELQDLSQHINQKHRAAQYAQRESVEIFQTLFFKDKPGDHECRFVDAIIYQLRDNGVLVSIPRYGIKGAVYMKNRDGQVAFVGESGVCEWTSGAISKTATNIIVNSVYGSHTYRLLDHITVKIVIQESRLHAHTLKLELVNNKPHITTCSTDIKGQKAEIIKEVRLVAEDNQIEDMISLGPNFEQWKKLYRQTPDDRSFYLLLQSLCDVGLMDI